MIELTLTERDELWHLCKHVIESNTIPEGVDADEIGKACLKLEVLSPMQTQIREAQISGNQIKHHALPDRC